VRRKRTTVVATAALLIAVLACATVFLIRQSYFKPDTITADFTSATGIYPGDGVRVAGIKVGTVATIQPRGTQAQLTLVIDHDVPIPADAKAIIVAQNLVAARYVQLTPAYEDVGPTMPDGAVIPVERTAVPVEWDEVKTQLMRLATDLGPSSDVSGTSVSRFIDSAANAMNGNGDKLRQALAQLSGVGRILADGSGDIAAILKNLQTFVTALEDSDTQIVEFEDHLATLSSVLNGSRSDIDSALNDLSVAVGEVQRFIAGTRDKTAEQIQRLANVTQNVADHRVDLENVLHVAPNAFGNGYAIYNPDTGSPIGSFVFNNMSNPIQFICGAIGAVENVTGTETSKLCAQYLGPALNAIDFNYLPFGLNPYLARSPQNVIYSDPALAPGGAGPTPGVPDKPPATSAYTGANNDVAPPPGYVVPTPPANLNDMLLPDQQALPPGPLPAEAPAAATVGGRPPS
jgi:phospholipid/cholesterol/gamma-HCH transport system substrate-binding protein